MTVLQRMSSIGSPLTSVLAVLSTAALLVGCAATPQSAGPSKAELAEADRRAFVAQYIKTPEGAEALRRSWQACQAGDKDLCVATFAMLGVSPEVAINAFHGGEATGAVVGSTLCFSTPMGHGDFVTLCD